jgi:hypothetical protein
MRAGMAISSGKEVLLNEDQIEHGTLIILHQSGAVAICANHIRDTTGCAAFGGGKPNLAPWLADEDHYFSLSGENHHVVSR